jgi:hypothetical protein
MGRLRQRDIQDIIRLFENELALLSRVSKIEKMKIRKRVVNALSSAVALNIRKPEMFMSALESKLYDVYDLFADGWGFREKLAKKVGDKLQPQPDHPAAEQEPT